MITTVPAEEILGIVHSTHGKPNAVLGMHEVEVFGRTVPVVRVFAPWAETVTVVEQGGAKERFPMQRIHAGGLFEAICHKRQKRFAYALEFVDPEGRQHTSEDPYAYPSTVSPFDRYLFNRAIHYQIYDKMGAHRRKVDGVEGVQFSVWAPNARRVNVVGDFNHWDGRGHAMSLHEDSGVWELFVPRLAAGEIYKYEIKSDAGDVFMKTDPYGQQFELRPKTGSVVPAENAFEWDDAEWLERRQETDWKAEPILIYEVHPGSWKRRPEDGNRWLTYRELSAELVPYLVEMGYTHVELMAIQEHPFDGSWGYQVTGYFAPTSRFGTPDDFRAFVDACHRHGIGVILDWVPGHFPKDPHGLASFDGSALYEHEDPRQGEHPDWGTKVFNYGRFEVANFLIANAMYWIDKFHIDGLRVDAVASMLYLDYSREEGNWIPNKFGGRENLEAVEFLKHLNSMVAQSYPGVLMIAEESTSWPMVSRPTEEGGLGFGFKWNMGWMHDTLEYFKRDPIHRRFNHDDLTFTMLYAFSENFILPFSHDEVVHGKGSLMSRMPGDDWQRFANLRLLYTFMATFPGKQLTFMGCEFAQHDEWNYEHSLDWHLLEFESHRQIQQLVRDLNHLVRDHVALHLRDLQPEGFQWINGADAENSVLAFIRHGDNGQRAIVVMNFTPVVRHDYRIGVPEARAYREVFNSDSVDYGGSDVRNGTVPTHDEEVFGFPRSIGLNLPPLGGVVLVPEAG